MKRAPVSCPHEIGSRARMALALGATLLALALPGIARADVFGPIELASASAVPGDAQDQQANAAEDSDISADGRFVVFDGSFGGKTGVFRRDLLTGAVAVVAEGDAVLPSISEDGQYVSFTTTERLDEQNDTNVAPDVYVRDMSKPDDQPCPAGWEASEEGREQCAFTLVSAVNGSPEGLSYKYDGIEPSAEETRFGALAAGRSALSANGHEVAFVTTTESNLANPARPAEPTGLEEPQTPALQVAVRNLETRETMLVSVLRDPATGEPELSPAGQTQPVPTQSGHGAVYGGGSPPRFKASSWVGASINADGSTVAWMGQQIALQAPTLANDLANQSEYTEPLWRRIDEGPRAPTRRVTGGSDPGAPECANSGESQLTVPPTLADPCQGPLNSSSGLLGEPGVWTGGTSEDYLPRLSANGMTVAFLSNAREIASGEEFDATEGSSDLYVVDMREGLTRLDAQRRLTELAGDVGDFARVAPIVDYAISPDGSQVAFATQRIVFPLGSPAFVSAPAAALGIVDLYDADLADETLTRVTQGFEGQQSAAPTSSEGRTYSPSFSADGDLLAFTSEADNLVYGDGNKASDAFVVERERFAKEQPANEISAAPTISLAPVWELGVTAFSRKDGTVQLEVNVPGPGTLAVGAQSTVTVRSSTRARGAHGAKARRSTRVATRTVASRGIRSGAAGLLALTLKLGHRYSALAAKRGGLSATVTVSFGARGHKTLRQRLTVTFVRANTHKRSRRARNARHSGAAKKASSKRSHGA
jgi:WD40-like Beta Propeller Repeat